MDNELASVAPAAALSDDQQPQSASAAAAYVSFASVPVMCAALREEAPAFFKGCRWSPDGTCVLAASEDNSLYLYNLPYELYNAPPPASGATFPLAPSLASVEGETIYDYTWNPCMTSANPESCFYVSSSRDHPVHLWDAYTGSLKATYRAFDHLDEITAAYAVCLNPDGTQLYCGYAGCVRIFDVDRPGRDCSTQKTVVGKKDGQRGILSTIAFAPDHVQLYACGSYSKNTGLYDSRTNESIAVLDNPSGVTQVLFSPTDGQRLYCGHRRNAYIQCWDTRFLERPIYCIRRTASTNQRIQFDMDRTGRFLATGNQDGTVTLFDTWQPPDESGCLPLWSGMYASPDAINGVSMHPVLPILAATMGQRKFAPRKFAGDDSDDDNGEPVDESERTENQLRFFYFPQL